MQNMSTIAGSYLEHFSLNRDPFEPSDAFFPGAGRQLLLGQLLHLSQFSSAVLVVSGALGSGRTSFARQYALEVNAWADHVSFIDIAALHQPEELFVHLAKAYGLCVEEGANSGELLVDIRQAVQQVPLVLVCDGAELLDDKVLSALLSLLQGPTDQSPLRVLLTGDDKLVTRLDAFGMLDVLIQDWQLDDFSRADILQYLNFLLVSAGGAEEGVYSDAELERLWRLSDGLPGRVLVPARELLVDKAMRAAEALSRSDRSVSIWYLGAAACCAAFLVVSFLYRDDLGVQPESNMPQAVLESVVAIQAPEPLSSTLVDNTERGHSSDSGSYKEDAVLSGPDIQPVLFVPAVVKMSLGVPAPDEVFAEPASRLPPASPEAPFPELESDVTIVVKPVLTDPVPSLGDKSAGLDLAEQHLMSLDEAHFVLQVLGAASREAVEQFVALQENSSDLYIFVTERDGKPWYTVVIGDYPSRTEAQVAIKSLPEGQRVAGAWPRSLEDVHSIIGKNRGI